MSICGSCLDKRDKGKSVDAALESARNYASRGSLDNAKQEYNFVVNTLSEKNGCQSCIKDAKSERDRNT